MPGDRARTALAGTLFADVRWLEQTGSTNADVLELARQGEPEGVVLVADHQTTGRGRAGRSWEAPPGSSLLVSLLLRPPAAVMHATTMAVAVAATDALDDTAGVQARLKWPNDLVVDDRKLAGILAEADWPATANIAAGYRAPGPDERVVVVAGIGINVSWPAELPDGLAEIAVAVNHLAGRDLDREDLLVSLLRSFDAVYGELVSTHDAGPLLERWRDRSATLGRRVRLELGADDVVGTAVDVTAEGHLVVDTLTGERRTFATADVIHLRSFESEP